MKNIQIQPNRVMQQIFENIKKYNIWDGQLLEIGYERCEYLEKISESIGTQLIKVIVGQRRVGKSYILRQIINLLTTQHEVKPHNIFFINKEFTAFDDIKSASDLEDLFTFYRKQFQVKGKIYIFLDEV
ncbi:MAG: AAA family ATPase, partial [Bacteroidales bacterium]|nr:AAA family ATPase [Bacteroidales bacterium]